MTVFNIRYNQFEYLVILFGLYNIAKIFQSYIYSLLQQYPDIICIVYLDNFLIYSKNNKKHTDYILKILKQLGKKNLQLDIDKCEFFIIEVKYLRLKIITKSICIDSEKVQAIIN